MTHANQLQRRDSHLFVGISGEGSQSLQREVERPRVEGGVEKGGKSVLGGVGERVELEKLAGEVNWVELQQTL